MLQPIRLRRESHADDVSRQRSLSEAELRIKGILATNETRLGYDHLDLCESLSQLAMLQSMEGRFDEAVALLQRQLSICEKHGNDIKLATALHELATIYRILKKHDDGIHLLLRALSLREKALGCSHEKVGETLTSLSIDYHYQGELKKAEEAHLRSLEIFHHCVPPEDENNEEVPWEVFKRLRLKRESSLAQNSLTLLKGNLRMEAQALIAARRNESKPLRTLCNPTVSCPSTKDSNHSLVRSLSAGSLASMNDKKDCKEILASLQTPIKPIRHKSSSFKSPLDNDLKKDIPHQAVTSFQALVLRVESVQSRLNAGYPDVANEIERLGRDIELIAAGDLRDVGILSLSLVRNLLESIINNRNVPVLEGYLEKESPSIFKGWERRWFKADPSSLLIKYYPTKQDCLQQKSPRGYFSIVNIVEITLPNEPGMYRLDITVNTGKERRTYKLKCDSEDDLDYWIKTLANYKDYIKIQNSSQLIAKLI